METPLSGSLARVGTGMSEGINVATDVFNRKNGKHRIKLITIDDESSPAKAVAAVEKLASQGVVAITGGYGSATSARHRTRRTRPDSSTSRRAASTRR